MKIILLARRVARGNAWLFALASSAVLFAANHASAQAQRSRCEPYFANYQDCTREIQSGRFAGKELAQKFFNRCRGLEMQPNQYERMIADCSEALKHDPGLIQAHLLMGRFHFSIKRDLNLAISNYTAALAIDPRNLEALESRANALAAAGERTRAVEDLTAIIAIKPTARNYSDRAALYNILDDLDRALADYSSALALNPGDHFLYAIRSRLYERKGDLDRALADIDEAIRREATPHHYLARARIHSSKNANELAMADYNASIKLEPTDNAHFERGLLYGKMGDRDRQLADYGAAIELNPNMAEARGSRCWALATLNRDLPKALTDCDMAIRAYPKYAEFYDSRGFVYFRLNRFKEALGDYDQTLKLKPDHTSAMYMRGITKLKSGEKESGESDIAAAKAKDAKVAETFEKYGVKP